MKLLHRRNSMSIRVCVLGTAIFLAVLLTVHILLSPPSPPHYRGVITYSNEALPTVLPELPPVILLTSAFKGQYSDARQRELSLVAARNQRLSSISAYHRLFEHGLTFTESKHGTGRVLSPNEQMSYRTLFLEAQQFAGVVVLANADIYFDESLLCAGMLSNRTVLALSRHPSPDCFEQSARGPQRNEPVDFCAGYHPKKAASHDVFVFVSPLPLSFLDALDDLKVNQFGAENVVVSLFKAAGFDVINPCSNIHAFHQHCTGERAGIAKKATGNMGDVRGQFGATFKSGFIHGREWMETRFSERFGGADCLGFGMMHGESLRRNDTR